MRKDGGRGHLFHTPPFSTVSPSIRSKIDGCISQWVEFSTFSFRPTDTLPAVTKPGNQVCTNTQVGATQYNVTLRGGIKAGKFLDKGIVGSMKECTRFCCAEDTCNVAFLIRDNCFLVACKDYNGCRLKPALSEYYHPQLAYVNWDPPVSEAQG